MPTRIKLRNQHIQNHLISERKTSVKRLPINYCVSLFPISYIPLAQIIFNISTIFNGPTPPKKAICLVHQASRLPEVYTQNDPLNTWGKTDWVGKIWLLGNCRQSTEMGIFQVYYSGIHQLQHEMKMHFKYFQPKNALTIKLHKKRKEGKNEIEIKVERQTKRVVGGRFKWFFDNIANGEWFGWTVGSIKAFWLWATK